MATTMCSIGVSAARARRGCSAVVQRPPPATAAPVARAPLTKVRRVIEGVRRRGSGIGSSRLASVETPAPASGAVRVWSPRQGSLSRGVADSAAEARPVLRRDQRALRAGLDLLDGPRVAVGVLEAEEGAAVALVEDHHLADLDATVDQLLPCGAGVWHDQLEAAQRPRSHLVLGGVIADHDRTARPPRGELDDVHLLGLGVVVELEADLVTVER